MAEDRAPTPSGTAPQANAADPSMEDILASIRRILNEDEPVPAEAARPPMPEPLALTEDMLVREPEPPPPPAAIIPPAAPPAAPPAGAPPPAPPPAGEALLGTAAAAAAAASVGSLLRAVAQERGSAIHRAGPTIEDVVREELRPLLKDWLDQHLPGVVERLVRAEIERVVGRALS